MIDFEMFKSVWNARDLAFEPDMVALRHQFAEYANAEPDSSVCDSYVAAYKTLQTLKSAQALEENAKASLLADIDFVDETDEIKRIEKRIFLYFGAATEALRNRNFWLKGEGVEHVVAELEKTAHRCDKPTYQGAAFFLLFGCECRKCKQQVQVDRVRRAASLDGADEVADVIAAMPIDAPSQ